MGLVDGQILVLLTPYGVYFLVTVVGYNKKSVDASTTMVKELIGKNALSCIRRPHL